MRVLPIVDRDLLHKFKLVSYFERETVLCAQKKGLEISSVAGRFTQITHNRSRAGRGHDQVGDSDERYKFVKCSEHELKIFQTTKKN